MKPYLLFLFSFILLSCNSDDDESFDSFEIVPVEIATGNVFNLDFQPNTTINSFIDNSEFWNFFVENTWQIPNPPQEAEVDFEEEIVIICIDHVRPTTGYDITITSIVENASFIEIEVEYTKSDDISDKSTRPYHIVKIPETKKNIKFNRVGL